MHHVLFSNNNNPTYKAALLIKLSGLNQNRMMSSYVEPLIKMGAKEDDFVGFSLEYNDKGKCPVNDVIRPYLNTLLKALESLQVKTLYVADTEYFKVLSGKKNAIKELGYSHPCAIKGYEHMSVIYGINYQALFYNPNLKKDLDMTLETLYGQMSGCVFELGAGILHTALYPKTDDEIDAAFEMLHTYPELTLDTETFSLDFMDAGLGTFAFSWDEHNGVAFECDYQTNPLDPDGLGIVKPNPKLKAKLREFLATYLGVIKYHNASYDLKVLVFELFMFKDLMNIKGMIEGIEMLCKNIDDTKLIAYLATNNAVKNELSLKRIAHEFAGNYAQDEINDITKIKIKDLLKYNIVDCLCTAWTYKKHWPTLVADNQKQIYDEIFIPSVKVILQIELTGMPIDINQVKIAEKELVAIRKENEDIVINSPSAQLLLSKMRQEECDTMNAQWKKKTEPLEYFDYVTFNPGSGPQIQRLIYEVMGYDVIDKTDTGQPSTGGDTIKKLIVVAKSDDDKKVLNALLELAEVSTIIDNFISNFLSRSRQKSDGNWYLFGSFNLGGTVSGRLSSSKPNMQNIPSSGTKYAKIIKRCFKAPKGYLFVGADFSSLEDRISALTTKDPEKLKVYTGIVIYELNVNGTIHHIRDDDTIEYDGKTFTGAQFYDTYCTL